MAADSIPRRPDRGIAPLSFGQQRLWFLEQLEPGTPAYHTSAAYRIEGSLDRQALERSLRTLVERHEALRTHIEVLDDVPMQVVDPPGRFSLEVVDLGWCPSAEREREALERGASASLSPFDLARGPLFRSNLYVVSPTISILVFVMHHMMSDGWSARLLFGELSTIYGMAVRGKSTTLPHPWLQYGDFAAWQVDGYHRDKVSDDIDFWVHKLAGLSELALPADPIRSDVDRYEGAEETVTISGELATALQKLGRRHRTTLFMTMVAALDTLLFRRTGQEDIVVGSPTSGRDRIEVEGIVGLFLNVIPLRVSLSGSPTFADLLARVRDAALDALGHQQLPFEKLVEELSPERRLDRDPIISAMVNFIPAAWRTLDLNGMPVQRLTLPERSARFPLTLYIVEEPGGLVLRLVCQRALFGSGTMRSLLDQLVFLLEQVAADPGQAVTTYSLVTPTARRVLPDPMRRLEAPHYEETIQQFASWVERSPDAVALRQEGYTWSYGDVDALASTLVRGLGEQGIRAGDVVALHGPSSVALVAGIIGVWRCGGVVLTLDPDLPELRIDTLLRESMAQHLLSWNETRPAAVSVRKIPSSPDLATTVSLDRPVSGAAPPGQPVASEAAYVFFTSGTTGTPRGVVGTHAGLSHFLDWQRQTFGVVPGHRVAQLTGLSFDVVLRDLFLPLTSGATLCLPGSESRFEPARVLEWITEERITQLHAVPSLADLWLTAADGPRNDHVVRQVFFAGEPLPDRLVQRWREVFPGCEVVNLYGPTETTLAKSCYRVPASEPVGMQPVGSVLPHTQVLVLTPGRKLCGVGEPGEIFIRTPFRTRGYLRKADTAAHFIVNPFREEPSDIVYRTGDRGRYRPDGMLEILGRLDDQIKIRGVRIEPSEIAATLSGCPGVGSSFVMARKDGDTDVFLAAYVVPGAGDMRDAAAIRTFLSQRLPTAMIPATVVFLDALPLTPNGKVDRAALPVPAVETMVGEDTFVAPRTEVERQIAEVWSEVLGVEQVGIHCNFFDLGGHSIAALRVINRLQGEMLRVSLRMLFEAPTLVDLAQRIGRGR